MSEDPGGLEYPKIRPVEAIPTPDGSRKGICLRDPRQIAENILVLPPTVFFIVSQFDGTHSLRDIQEICFRQYGELIPLAKIREIAEQLDRELFLESERYEKHRLAILQAFRDALFREPAHAGTAYAGEPDSLREQLDGLLRSIRDASPDESLEDREPLSLLIAPHIDLHRGGICFAHAYRELIRRPPADLYVILGTGHQSERSPIAMTQKSYRTPLGNVETDIEFVEEFRRRVSIDIYEEELLHRDEHSIEFQTLWLRHVLGQNWRGKAVPILCGSFHPFVVKGQSPREDSRVVEIVDALRTTIADYPGRVTVIAGVDLSHVGQRFGHSRGIPPDELVRVRRDDREVVEAIQGGDAEVFYRTIEKKKDRNNVCGLSPIYLSLDVVRPSPGRLLSYDLAIETETQSVVTFASLAFSNG